MSVIRFHELLKKKVSEAIETRIDTLANGMVSGDDAATVGMNYKDQTGYLRGMRDALKLAEEVETEMNN